jgi:hypothetical protein
METLSTEIHGLPATKSFGPVVIAISGPAAGCRSGAAPGQMGICVCPGDGCQTEVWMGVWAGRAEDAERRQRAASRGLITVNPAYEANTWIFSLVAEGIGGVNPLVRWDGGDGD